MVVLEVLVVILIVQVFLCCNRDLIESLGDVALLIQIIWSYLREVEINHVGVVTIDVHQLILVLTININRMLNVEMFVRQNNLWVAVLVTRGSHVKHLQIPLFLLLIDRKEEVFLGNHFIVSLCGQLFSRHLVLELNELNLFLHDSVDLLPDASLVLSVSRLTEFVECSRNAACLFQRFQVCSLIACLRSILLHLDF